MRLIDGDGLIDEICRDQCERKYKDCDRTCEIAAYVVNAPTVGGWISVKDKLPPNADHPGAFCPKYQVMTKYGVTEGWYNPDKGCWYTLVWFYLGRKTFDDIDYERGDIPGITDKIEVTHWQAMPEPPKEDA